MKKQKDKKTEKTKRKMMENKKIDSKQKKKEYKI